MDAKNLTTSRTLFFASWVLLFASFYVAHWGLTWDQSPVLGGYAMQMVIVLWLGQWVWVVVYRNSEPELTRLSMLFLLLFLFMLVWDAPIVE